MTTRDDYDINDEWGEQSPHVHPVNYDDGPKKLRLTCAYLLGFGVGVLLVLAALQVRF